MVASRFFLYVIIVDCLVITVKNRTFATLLCRTGFE